MNFILALAVTLASSALPGEPTYIRAAEHAQDGQHGDAIHGFERVVQVDPTLAPYAKLRAANSRGMAGDLDGAIRETRAVIDEHATGPWVQWAHFQLARLLQRKGDLAGAAPYYKLAGQSPVELWWIEDVRWEGAENALKVPEYRNEGMDFFRDQVNRTRWYAKRLEAARYLAESDRAEDRIHAALGLIRSREYTEASKVAASIPQTWLTEPNLERQWQELSARLLIVQGRRTEGEQRLEALAQEHPHDTWADKALLYAGISLIQAQKWDEAERVMLKLQSSYPSSDSAVEGFMRLARAYAGKGDLDTAWTWFQRVVSRFPDRIEAGEALLEAGNAYRLADRKHESIAMYDQLLADYPHHDDAPEAGYWAGRILFENNQESPAKKRFEQSVDAGLTQYYGFRSQEYLAVHFGRSNAKAPSLGITPQASIVRPVPQRERDPGSALKNMEHDRRFDRLRFFAHYGLEEAEWEALYLLNTIDDHADPELMYRAIGEAGTAYSAMQWADSRSFGQLEDGRQSVERLRIRYPRPYWDVVTQLGEELNLDPYLILSIARQESTYRPSLTSSAGAKGVLQLMPSTAKWLGDTDPRITKDTASRLEVPIHSLRMGAVYFRRMLDRSDQNVAYALASYNAGPGNFDKWERHWRSTPTEEFIELIPFSETNTYVKRILAHYATYKSIYE